MRKLLGALIAALTLSYPFLWYFGQQHGYLRLLSILMLLVCAARGWFAQIMFWRLVAWTGALFFALIAALDTPLLMMAYPLLVNTAMLVIFAASLCHPPSVIERLARIKEADLPAAAVRYTRRITQMWCAFFVCNGLMIIVLMWLNRPSWWTLYTGVIAYILMGILFIGEWLFRPFWQQHCNQHTATSSEHKQEQ
ncbi:hypothetical protein L0B52_04710 [Suttonella sp. R2A3]|uniref:COG4648 family protein n=1 Tax=Suttonella sp. R2A3 TaxID=2908648 RepID=UPI001F21F181|nr:hypothetical protein [Suttonella sp. R2A3]UJF23663.1 hypothetical protein L0B52_04710 [Suttonella sp. R2A3]